MRVKLLITAAVLALPLAGAHADDFPNIYNDPFVQQRLREADQAELEGKIRRAIQDEAFWHPRTTLSERLNQWDMEDRLNRQQSQIDELSSRLHQNGE